jgi:general secretion pathway protein A
LKSEPFNITADPEFYFSSQRHSEAFSHLIYGIAQRKGIILLTGEIGTGKTTICRTLLNQLEHSVKTAFIINPNFSDVQLLKMILTDLGIEFDQTSDDKHRLIAQLNAFLLDETQLGHNVVLIIDEAQNLDAVELEEIRLLSNLETEKNKLLQIILVGQPELLIKIKDPQLRQLRQRIAVRYHLEPLNRNDVEDYIFHRLKKACQSHIFMDKLKFTDKAINLIYQYSQGTPRLINILCDRALLAGYVSGLNVINSKIVDTCSKEILE